MKLRTLIAALAAALAGQLAMAQTAAPAADAPKTRAQVIAELQAARAAGERHPGDLYGFDPLPRSTAVGKSRAQVREELQQAIARGELRRGQDAGG